MLRICTTTPKRRICGGRHQRRSGKTWFTGFFTLIIGVNAWSDTQKDGVSEAADLNWVPSSELTEEQRAEVPSACCGAYVAPEIATPVGANTGKESFSIHADRIYGPRGTITAEGDVTITQQQQQIRAQKVVTADEQQSLTIEGPITINEPGSLFTGTRTFINRETGTAVIEQGQFVLYESRLRGGAALLERDENQVMHLTQGQFTQCEPGRDDWMVKGSQIVIDPVAQQGKIRNMRLELGGVPVVYLPYWTFPTGGQRQSGFLYTFPSTKDFAVPYYFNIAPNYDLTLAPRIIYDRGTLLEAEGRHLNRWFEISIGGSYLPNGKDDISRNERNAIAAMELEEFRATEFDDEDRWLISVQQEGGSNSRGPRQARALYGGDLPKWYSNIDYTKVSDYAYFRHINTSNLNINRKTHLLQQGELGYRFDHWDTKVRAEAYQSIVLDTREEYRQAPQVVLDGSYDFGELGTWQLSLENELTEFTHGDKFLNDDPTRPIITGNRIRADYRLVWDKQWIWGFFKPGAAVKSVSYQLNRETLDPGDDDQPGVTVPQGSLDTGLFFERDGDWFGTPYLQTFEPRVFYFYSDFEDQSRFVNLGFNQRQALNFDSNELTFGYNQLFRDTRFGGGDRIDDARQVSVGLTTRFLDTEQGSERLRLSVGQIYYHGDRRIGLGQIDLDDLRQNDPDNLVLQSKSNIAGQIAAQLTDSLQIAGNIEFDSISHRWDQRGINIRYYDDAHRIVNLGYRNQHNPGTTRERNRDTNQGQLSFVLPIAGNWSIIGHTFHDFTLDEALDSVFGVEYSDCCYRVRVVGRRWFDNELIELVEDQRLDHEREIFIELQLLGIGSVFDTIGSILSESIVNYERRDEALR